MNHQANYLNIIGLAYRARKCSLGVENIIQTMRNGNVHLLLIANDVSNRTKKTLIDKCHTFQVPYMEVDDRYTLGYSIGKEARVAIAITDKGFAKKIQMKNG